jgi:hypothetical protein
MHGYEVEDDVLIKRLGKIFKDMPPYTPCLVPEYSAARPPNKVSSRDRSLRVLIPPSRLVGDAQGKGEAKKKERHEIDEGDNAVVIEDSFDDEDVDTL